MSTMISANTEKTAVPAVSSTSMGLASHPVPAILRRLYAIQDARQAVKAARAAAAPAPVEVAPVGLAPRPVPYVLRRLER